ncbi:MAG: molybdopterin converting factor subunit 1 [Flavobacteriales bacterium]|jgi:molybdopterin converting factor subunit 1
MKIDLLAFGPSKEIIGQQKTTLELPVGCTSDELKADLLEKYPALGNLDSLRIAVNETYLIKNVALREGDEVAIIPPVSGG